MALDLVIGQSLPAASLLEPVALPDPARWQDRISLEVQFGDEGLHAEIV